MKAWQNLSQLIIRWRQDNRGAAVVEFALILPIMLVLYAGSIEASTLITMDRKVQSTAGAVGDLVARSDDVISTTQINDYFQAASRILAPYSAANLKQVVTSVQIRADGTTRVDWSLGFNGGTPHAVNASIELPNAIKDIVRNKYIIVAEASAPFVPMFDLVFQQDIPLYRQSFFMPRFQGDRIQCQGC
ncbi:MULTISPECIES: TadE/TadG family type IV pilus assembly protein [unclassified Devosia]|uniref:TadE/TadG family type IV pilus assembly protein n=1 Tax=unclassified Devosia TaxID=196773 RepID=UPI001553A215|nr:MULTISPECIES: TadE/TadG family type IV pilus assembly protein [unclassified Devosia]